MYYSTPDEILTRLESGFKVSSARLKAAEQELRSLVQQGREFGATHGTSPALTSQWDSVEEILDRIQRLSTEVDEVPQRRHDQKDIEHALRSGLADYWTKPLDLQRFLGSLQAILGTPG